MLSCGEASGDLYAGALIRALNAREPVEVFGFGGEQMRAAVDVGSERRAVFGDGAATGKTEDLIPARIGEDGF